MASLLAHDYLKREQLSELEFYVLLLLSASGGIIMTSAAARVNRRMQRFESYHFLTKSRQTDLTD